VWLALSLAASSELSSRQGDATIQIMLVLSHFNAIVGFTNLRLLGKLLDVVFPEPRRQLQHPPHHLSILRKSALALINQVKMDWEHTEELSLSPIA
jgi:hypothetical protein